MEIDPRGPRIGALTTTVVLAAVLISGSGWLLAAQALVFATGAALGLRHAPYGLLYRQLIRPRHPAGSSWAPERERHGMTATSTTAPAPAQAVSKLWTEENVSYAGQHFSVTGSTVAPRIEPRAGRPHPKLYFGGASEAAEKVAATEADVQLFWGEPLDGVRERIERLTTLSRALGREHAPLEFGLRVTTLVRDTTEEAWADAEARLRTWPRPRARPPQNPHRRAAVGQQRLFDLASGGEVLDDNLYTTPGRFGGGGAATTWLVGSAHDVAKSLHNYAGLGVTHFVLSDTPYLREIKRQGGQLLPLLRG